MSRNNQTTSPTIHMARPKAGRTVSTMRPPSSARARRTCRSTKKTTAVRTATPVRASDASAQRLLWQDLGTRSPLGWLARWFQQSGDGSVVPAIAVLAPCLSSPDGALFRWSFACRIPTRPR
ncbi:hypothetical protein XHV734_2057 [Xanthomonas hortorum pv. vitians]|nr:hypothetical protein XHV734_2057 [Xanthomonas hortorum pv. vitians]